MKQTWSPLWFWSGDKHLNWAEEPGATKGAASQTVLCISAFTPTVFRPQDPTGPPLGLAHLSPW